MKRLLAGAALSAICLACSGCLAVATVAAVGAVAVSTYKPAAKAPKAAGEATSQQVSAPAPVAAPAAPLAPATPVARAPAISELTTESAASLTQAGSVVVVDAVNGTRTTLAWHEGMKLADATGKPGGHHTARIFRGSRELPADLRADWTAGLALLPGDVIELRR